MSDYDRNLSSSTKADPAVSKAAIIGNVTEQTGTAAEDKRTEETPDEVDGKAPVFSSIDDDVEYVHGHPVIRNGRWLIHDIYFTIGSLLMHSCRHGRFQVRRVGSR